MTAVIYPIEGSWGWGGESTWPVLIKEDLGFKDFAGSGIVHLAGAAAALAAILLLGLVMANTALTAKCALFKVPTYPWFALGTFILWFGWFGFNGASVLKLGDITSAHTMAVVFLNTNAAAAGGFVGGHAGELHPVPQSRPHHDFKRCVSRFGGYYRKPRYA